MQALRPYTANVLNVALRPALDVHAGLTSCKPMVALPERYKCVTDQPPLLAGAYPYGPMQYLCPELENYAA